MVLRELITKLGFDIDEATLTRFERGIEAVKHSLEAIVGLEAGVVASLFEFTKKTSEYGEDVKRSALITGLSVEAYQKYRYAANLAGAENEEFTVGIRYLNRAVGEALLGIGEFPDVFKKLGVSQAALRSGSLDEVIPQIADGLKNLNNSSLAAAMGMKIFGRGGALMASFLSRGSEELNRYTGELSAFGIMTAEQAEESEHFEQSQKRLLAVITGIRNEIGLRLFPIVEGVMDRFRAWLMVNRDIVRANLEAFMTRLSAAAGFLWNSFLKVTAIAKAVEESLGGVANTAKLALTFLVAITGAQILIGLAALVTILKAINIQQVRLWVTNPYFLIAAAIGVVILGLQDLYTWIKGGESLLGDWLGPFDKFKAGIQGLLDPVKKVFREIWSFIVSEYESLVPAWMRNLIEKGASFLGSVSVPRSSSFPSLPELAGAPGFRGTGASGTWGSGGAKSLSAKIDVHVTAGKDTTPETAAIIGESLRPVIREEIGKAAGAVVANNPRMEKQ